MNLSKIRSEDLIFSNDIEDDRTNTYLYLYDYDWMDYNLTTRFKTKDFGVLNVKFSYFGMTSSIMEVEQNIDGNVEKITYEYSTDIFEKHIVKFLSKHISFWDNKYAFNGEEEVIEFFNDVIENGTIKNKMYSKIPQGYWIGGFLTRCIRIMPIQNASCKGGNRIGLLFGLWNRITNQLIQLRKEAN